MAETFLTRAKNAFNVFTGRESLEQRRYNYGSEITYIRPDRPRFTRGNERSIVTAVYNRIAMDVAALTINHVYLDENGRYKETINSELNRCLTLEANRDQTGRALLQDGVMSLLDEGCIALIKTVYDSSVASKIYEIRVGRIKGWLPSQVRVEVYNEDTMRKETILVNKSDACIIENPLYSVMNEPSSTMQRLIRKLNLLDYIDEQSGSGKLDLIIQLPYTVKSTARMDLAEKRRAQIESQLKDSKYGIAYIDATEKVTQLNRSLENNLLAQIEYLTNMLYSQLGLSQAILDGTADEKAMLNYNNRTIEPIISAFTNEMKRKWLTPTARTQGQDIKFFQDPFKLVPVDNIAEIADKFTRNEIMTSNEFRQIIGMKPSDDPSADELRNKNLSESSESVAAKNGGALPVEKNVGETRTSTSLPLSVNAFLQTVADWQVVDGEIQNG